MSVSNKLEVDKEFIALKDTHKEFIRNMLSGDNATDAYNKAFPKATRKSSGVKGCQFRAKYANLIARHSPLNVDEVKDIANGTLRTLAHMAFADPKDLYDTAGKLRGINELPVELRMCISNLSVDNGMLSYQFGGKLKALELLSKITRLQEERIGVEVQVLSPEEKEKKIKEILVKAITRKGEGNPVE